MSITQAIFPGLKPGQNFAQPSKPVRAPKWNYKETARWNNERQQSVNGRVIVLKYWSNPLWMWEWTYGYVKDNPGDPNPFYTRPIPATDFEILNSFYQDMQGGGNEFAYQPPDTVRGTGAGFFTVSSVAPGPTNHYALLTVNPASSLYIRLGDSYYCSNFSTATFLNTNNVTVVEILNLPSGAIQILVTGTFTYTGGTVSDSGRVTGGQLLSPADANGNIELVNTIGSYPTTITAIPTTTLVTESLQLIDTSTLVVYDGAGTNLNGTYTLQAPDSIAPYVGYVLNFGSAPTPPIRASFNQFYLCRFAEDTLEFDNFMAMLYMFSSVKFEQVRA